jgi:hypothetical protein
MLTEILPWLPAIVAVIGGSAAVWAAVVNRGGTRQARREPTWKELLERVGALEEKVEDMRRTDRRKMGAFARILIAIRDQWPTPTGPDLDPADIAEVEEAIPPAWIRRNSN